MELYYFNICWLFCVIGVVVTIAIFLSSIHYMLTLLAKFMSKKCKRKIGNKAYDTKNKSRLQ